MKSNPFAIGRLKDRLRVIGFVRYAELEEAQLGLVDNDAKVHQPDILLRLARRNMILTAEPASRAAMTTAARRV
ncbi:hypothetical protein GCM10027562_25190 [Arthrobacter pigmenti]